MTFPIPHPEKPGVELGVDEIRERAEYVLRGSFARIATVEMIAEELKSLEGSPCAVPSSAI